MEEQGEAGSGPIDVRWYFNFEKWHPTEEEWQKCLSLIPAEEQLRIGRFRIPTNSGNIVGRHNPNAKSSLIGRLMLRKCAEEQLGLATKDQVWRRTTEGKPFLLNIPTHLDSYTSSIDGLCRAAYNMNLSHDGQLVAFVSGRDFVLGVDVMANNRAGSEPSDVFFPIFDENFTTLEWKTINAPSSEAAKFEAFFHHWTLKESYIKSVGIGLGFELRRAEFTLEGDPPTEASVMIDSKPADHWHFEVHTHIQGHTISVAYGPLEDSMGSVKASLNYPQGSRLQPSNPLSKPKRLAFQELTIQELL